MNLSSKKVQALLKNKTLGPKVSLYLPTHPYSNSQTLSKDKIRFRNALKKIRNDHNLDKQKLEKILEPLQQLGNSMEFWKHQDIGLAIFADEHGFEYYHLPIETTKATYIGDELVISPLIIMQSIGLDFYVLDVNLTKPRLLKSKHGTLMETSVDMMPKSFDETIARDEYKTSLQHLAAPRGSGGDNRVHGHGPEDALKDDISQYIDLIAKAADGYLMNRSLPLLLVGEESRAGNIRKRIVYKQLIPGSVNGNVESYTPQKLYNAVIKKIESYDKSRRQDNVKAFLSSKPNLMVEGIPEIAEAATNGRVERMYIPAYKRTADSVRSGDFESVILQLPDNIGELEATVRKVLLQVGTIQAVEIGVYPEVDEPKALCRF